MSEKRKVPKLRQQDFGLEEFTHRTWTAMLSDQNDLTDVLEPSFWATVAQGPERAPRKHDKIQIRHEQGLFYAELMVMDSGEGWVKCELIGEPVFFRSNAVEESASSPLVPAWKIGTRSWSVERKSDKATIKAGFGTKAAAVAWIAEHERQTAQAA